MTLNLTSTVLFSPINVSEGQLYLVSTSKAVCLAAYCVMKRCIIKVLRVIRYIAFYLFYFCGLVYTASIIGINVQAYFKFGSSLICKEATQEHSEV